MSKQSFVALPGNGDWDTGPQTDFMTFLPFRERLLLCTLLDQVVI